MTKPHHNNHNMFSDFFGALRRNPISAFTTAARGVVASDVACRFTRYTSAGAFAGSVGLIGLGVVTQNPFPFSAGVYCGGRELSRLYHFGAEQQKENASGAACPSGGSNRITLAPAF